MRFLLRLLAWIISVFLIFQIVIRLVRKSHPFPMPFEASAILENPLRLRFMPVDKMIDRLGLAGGMRVLEIGPGPGIFTVEAARRVGPDGAVVAVDIEPKMLSKTEARVRKAGLTNVELVLADAGRLPLPDKSVDVAFLIAVLGEVPDKDSALAEVKRVLRHDGTLSITELLPDPDYSLKGTTVARCRRAGFTAVAEFGNFFAYTVNFRKLPSLA